MYHTLVKVEPKHLPTQTPLIKQAPDYSAEAWDDTWDQRSHKTDAEAGAARSACLYMPIGAYFALHACVSKACRKSVQQ